MNARCPAQRVEQREREREYSDCALPEGAPRYDAIGRRYAAFRREDPHISALIAEALGDARTVLNVGAGAGSYEPRDRHVVAVEPSDVMAAQRPDDAVPALRARAGDLPFRDGAFDASMAVLSLHHWDDERRKGVSELRRVAKKRVVIVTIDARVSGEMWLLARYLPEVAALDLRIFPPPEELAEWLGVRTNIVPIPVSRATPDWTLLSYWAHPERVFDPEARAATSGFARMTPQVIARVEAELRRDLQNGTWEREYGALRGLEEFDAGLRLIVGEVVP